MKRQNIRSILAAVDPDGEGARQVGRKAAALARLAGARLELFLCDAARAYMQKHQYDSASAAISSDACLGEAQQYLDRLWRALGIRDITPTMRAACESPLYLGIVHEVKRCAPDLVVHGAGTSFEGESTAHTPGATDWQLVRTCPAPLLLTRGRQWRPKPLVAAAIDLASEESPELTCAILRAAGDLARLSGGRLEIVHAGRFEAAAGDAESAEQASRRMALEQRAREAEVEVAAIHLIPGEPAAVLPAFAAARAYDLIALGALTHGKSFIALVGTLTGRLIEMLDSDFLLVKATYACEVDRRQADAQRPGIPHGAIGDTHVRIGRNT